jgi:hypothetical protein
MARFLVLAPAALLLLSACASPAAPPGGRHGGAPGGAGGFNMAVRMVDQGQYEEAMPILRCVAGQGQGFEIAQYLAGYTAIRLADAPETPEILRDELRTEGIDRLGQAARAGWPTAQAELATQMATIDNPDALDQAAYWAAVYRRNVRDRAMGLDRLDDGVERRITERTGAEREAQIEELASLFAPQAMTSVTTTPACQPFLGGPSFGGGPGAGTRRRGPPPGQSGQSGTGRPGGSDRPY